MADPFNRKDTCSVNTNTCIPLSEICDYANLPIGNAIYGVISTEFGPKIAEVEGGNVEIYVDDGSFSGYILTLNDTDPATPAVNISLETLPDTLAGDPAFVQSLRDQINTDDQNASEVLMASGQTVEDCVTDNKNRISALEASTVTSVTQNADGDYVVTNFDGSTTVLDDIDVPEIAATDNGDGTGNVTVDGSVIGTFLTAANQLTDNGDGTATITAPDGTVITVDTDGDDDTVSSPWVVNPDGTATVTDTDGVQHIVPVGGPDADTTYSFALNPNGSITVSGSDGSSFTSAPTTVDTDTFSTLTGSTITFANGDTLEIVDEVDSVTDGGSNLVDNSDTDNPIIRPLLKCDGSPINVLNEAIRSYSEEQVVTQRIFRLVSGAEIIAPGPHLFNGPRVKVVTSNVETLTNPFPDCSAVLIVLYDLVRKTITRETGGANPLTNGQPIRIETLVDLLIDGSVQDTEGPQAETTELIVNTLSYPPTSSLKASRIVPPGGSVDVNHETYLTLRTNVAAATDGLNYGAERISIQALWIRR